MSWPWRSASPPRRGATVADISDVQVSITLTIGELRDLVALINLASEALGEDDSPEVVGEVSGLYFELMENLRDGILGDFQPE